MSREILQLSRRVRTVQITSGAGELRCTVNSATDFFYRCQLPSLLVNNPRRFWSSISPKASSTNSILVGSEITNDPVLISNAFNVYFQSVFSLDNNVYPSFPPTGRGVSVTDIDVTVEGVLTVVLNLDSKICPGPDGIPNLFLIRYSQWTSRYLAIIFRKSLSSGVVSSSWKLGKVLPFFKSGDKQSIGNYRPISLTS